MGRTTTQVSLGVAGGDNATIYGFINGVQISSLSTVTGTIATTRAYYSSTISPQNFSVEVEVDNTGQYKSASKNVWVISGTTLLWGDNTSGSVFTGYGWFSVASTTGVGFKSTSYVKNGNPMNVGNTYCFAVENVTGIAPFTTTWNGDSSIKGTTYCVVIEHPQTAYNASVEVKASNGTNKVEYSQSYNPATTLPYSNSIGITVSESTTIAIVGADVGIKFTVSTVQDNAYPYEYLTYYTDLNGTTFVSTTVISNSTDNASTTFTISPTSSPNDNSLGRYELKFAYKDYYSNYSTSSIYSFQVINIFGAVLTVSDVGELANSTSSTKWYYLSPLENPLFLTYIQWRQNAIVQTNFSYAFYTNNIPSKSILASTVVLSSTSPPVFSILGANYTDRVNATTYVFSVMANRISTTPSYSTSNLIGLFWNDPLTVSISTTLVEGTAGVKLSTTLRAYGYGGGVATAYDYTWYKNGVSTGVKTSTYSISTTYNVGQNYVLFALVESVETKESLSTSPVNVVIKSPVSVSISPSSLSGGIVGRQYSFYANVSGGVSPYDYTWFYSSTANVVGSTLSLNFSTTIAGSNILGVSVKDKNGSGDKVTINTSFYDYPTSVLSSNKSIVLTSSTVTFTDVSQGSSNFNYAFYVNGIEKSSGSGANFSFSTTATGTYNVYCQVEDLDTHVVQDSNIIQIQVVQGIGAEVKVQYSTTVVTVPDAFMVNGVYGFPPYSYTWYYNTSESTSGAILISSTQVMNFSTTVAGLYYVFAHVSDSASHSINSSFVEIKEVSKPSVSISGPTLGNTNVVITWTSNIVNGSGNYSYTWYLDGKTNISNGNFTSSTFSTTFTSDGTYTINLEVYDKGYRYTLPLSNTITLLVAPVATLTLNIKDTLTMHNYLTGTKTSTSASPSTTSLPFTVLVNGRNVHAMNISSERNIDVAGELDFTVVKRYMYSTTNGSTTFMTVGSPVQFYLYNNLVFSGVVNNINMQSNMQYKVQAYDGLYYLAGTRLQTNVGSPYSPVDLATMFGKLVSYSTVNYDTSNIGYGGFSAEVFSTQSFYYELLQLATILGYGTYLDNSNTLHLQPLLGANSTTIVENVNCIFSTTVNDTNYFYNTVNLIANSLQTTTVCSTTNSFTTCQKFSTTVLSSTVASVNISGASATAKKVDLSWLSVNGGGTWANGMSVSLENLANVALSRFEEGYREIDVWYSLSATNATTFLNVGSNVNITAKFVDGREWNNLFISQVNIDSTGLYLTLVNFPKDIWSQISSVTAYS